MPKINITKEEFEALSDGLKELYAENGDNYRMALEDYEDVGALKAAKDALLSEKKAEQKKARELQEKLDEIERERQEGELEGKRKKGDVQALEKSWSDKHEATENKYKGLLSQKDKQIEMLLIDNQAKSIASEISTIPDIFEDIVKKRMRVEADGDTVKLRILDKNGEPSALTIEEFKQELLANERYAAILVGSRASGGGAGQSSSNGGGATKKKWGDYTATERAALYKSNPAEYDRLSADRG